MILLLTPFFPPNLGGVEIHLADYLEFLKKEKIETYVLTYQPITTKTRAPFKEKNGSITTYRFPYLGFNLFYKLDPYPLIQFLYLFFGLFLYTFFFLLLNFRKVEVIHSHGFASGLTSGLFGKIFKKRSVVSLHTIYKFSQRPNFARFAKKILNLNDHILAIAQACKDDLVKIGIPSSKITVYSYWVDTNCFKPVKQNECREKLNLPPNDFIALFIGRFTPEKQLKEALESARQAKEVSVLFIGQGPLGEEVKKSADNFSNIKLIGKVENKNLPLYHNAADLLLLGPVDEDYFGKVTMEAMASGLPVLISDESYYFGKRKKIKPGILPVSCGFMVDLEAKIIAQKLSELAKNHDKLLLMRRACRDFAKKHFSEKNAQTIFETYKL